jgi:cytidylate kinase
MVQAGVLAGEDYRRETEILIREHTEGGAVILGRAAAVILRDCEHALHVRLDGPPERRVQRAMELEGLSREDAERLRRDGDRAREAYVRHFYNCDARDPALYHLVIDATALPTDTVGAVIAAATRRTAA